MVMHYTGLPPGGMPALPALHCAVRRVGTQGMGIWGGNNAETRVTAVSLMQPGMRGELHGWSCMAGAAWLPLNMHMSCMCTNSPYRD